MDRAVESLGPAEGRWVLERASGRSGAELMADLGSAAPAAAARWCAEMVQRRALGEPLQYVLGRWGFRGLELLMDRRVLIPRPETEVVVTVALAELRRLQRPPTRTQPPPGGPPAVAGRPGDARWTRPAVAADLGTGSGAIALALAAEEPRLQVWASDCSADALAVVRANLAGLGTLAAPRVRLVQGDWYGALPPGLAGAIDLVVSNPPYVAEGEDLPQEVAVWEPQAALVAGPSGLEAIEAVVQGAPHWLARPGALVVEIAPHQAQAAAELAGAAGFEEADVSADLSGRPRVLVGRVGWR